MSLDREIALQAQRDRAGKADDVRLRVKRLRWRRRITAFRRCFCDADGAVTADGALVLGFLGELAGLGVARPLRSDAEMRFNEGQRHVVLDMIEWLDLDGSKLAALARKLKERDDL